MLELFAPKLQSLYGPVPVVTNPSAALNPPYLFCSSWSGGDPYSGTTSSVNLRLEVQRPETGLLRIKFDYALHELSGQCDEWRVEVNGAVDSEREALWVLFHPRQQRHHWNEHISPAFKFNGAEVAYR